jgi:hypothetical protein
MLSHHEMCFAAAEAVWQEFHNRTYRLCNARGVEKGVCEMSLTLWSQLIWLLAIALASFLVTWIFTDLFHLEQTPYIGVLAVVTGVLLTGYLSWSNTDWVTFLSYQWLWGLVAAIIVSALNIVGLLRGSRSQTEMFTPVPRPEGVRLVGALLWEGLVYGMAEGFLLSVLPVLITWQALSSLHWTQSWYGIILSGIIALAASIVVIMVHHLGYREFRGRKLLSAEAGCAPLSLAYLLTMNPLAACLGHSILHMAAVLRGIELPPHQEKSGHAVENVMPAH